MAFALALIGSNCCNPQREVVSDTKLCRQQDQLTAAQHPDGCMVTSPALMEAERAMAS